MLVNLAIFLAATGHPGHPKPLGSEVIDAALFPPITWANSPSHARDVAVQLGCFFTVGIIMEYYRNSIGIL